MVRDREIARRTREAQRDPSYLEEGLVGRRRRRNLDRVELLLEDRPVIVNVRYLDDDPGSRR